MSVRVVVTRCLLAPLFLVLFSAYTQAAEPPKSYRLGFRFESNEGQYPAEVKFVARQPGSELFLTSNEAIVTWPTTRSGVHIELLNVDRNAQVAGEGRLSGTTNYILGNDPAKWRTGAAVFEKVRYHNLYPGIDLLYYGSQEKVLEHDFVVAPGASLENVRLRISGADEVTLTPEGDLRLSCSGADLTLKHPVAYQKGDKGRPEVASHFVLHSGNEVTIEAGAYDHSRELVVDPQLQLYYNNPTFGGTSVDLGNGVAADAQGNMYIVGTTFSSDIQFSGTVQSGWQGATNCGPFGTFSLCSDAFVVKIDPSGNVVYFTYLGGNLNDTGSAIGIDSLGNAYITGSTQSQNFPVLNAAQPNWGGGTNCGATGEVRNCTDAYVAALDANGNLLYATYLGGSGNDAGTAIAVTPAGTAWVTGIAVSTDLVASQGAFATSCAIQNNQCNDGFIAQVSSSGVLNYLSYLRGSGADVAIDGAGLAYVTGTASSNFLTTANPFQGTAGGTTDGFLVTVDATQSGASSLAYASYLGLNGGSGSGVTVDSVPDVYVTTVAGLIARVMKFDLTKTGSAQRLYNTLLPSPSHVTAMSPRLDGSGNLYFVGTAQQQLLPSLPPSILAYAASVNANGVFSGSDLYDDPNVSDVFSSLAVDPTGAVYVTGTTYSFTPGQNNPGDVVTTKFVVNQPSNWQIYPNPVVFPKQGIGGLLQTNVYALNETGASDTISNVAMSPGFKMDAENCTGLAVKNGVKCTFLFEFTGKNPGITTGYLTFTTGATPTNRKVLLYIDAGLPSVSFSPATVDFGTVALGDTATKMTVLSNTGDGVYPLGAIAAPNVRETHDCGVSVPAKGTCNFTLTFTPQTNTDVAGNMAVSPYPNGAAYSLVPPVSLNVAGGTQSPAGVTLLPATLTFTQAQGTSLPQLVTLTNGTASAIGNLQLGTTGNFALDNGTTTCGSTLAANSTCTVGVTFTPSGTTTAFGTMTESDSNNGLTVNRAVGLVGNGAGTPSLSVSPTSLSFGSLLVNTTTAPKTITLSNQSTATGYLAVSSIAPDGPYSESNNCALPLAPAASCTITVTFTPSATGSQPGHVTILSNAAKKVINLSGTGNAPLPVLSSISPTSSLSGSSDLTVTLTGSKFSSNSIAVWKTATASTNLVTTYVSSTTLTAVVPAALMATPGSATINVSTPTPGGGSSATKAFTINPGGPAVGAASSIAFGNMVVGGTLQQSLTITNIGTGTLSVTSLPVTGPFWVVNGCGSGVAAGASCAVLVSFAPATMGPASGMLTINSNGTAPAVAVSLSGNGVSLTLLGVRPPRPSRLADASASSIAVGVRSAITVSAPNVSGIQVRAQCSTNSPLLRCALESPTATIQNGSATMYFVVTRARSSSFRRGRYARDESERTYQVRFFAQTAKGAGGSLTLPVEF